MAGTAVTLNCLMCGAPARTDASQCAHCGARLATRACPSCFGMIFQGSKFCGHCGARADRVPVSSSRFVCPHCDSSLKYLRLGNTDLSECPKCDGLWLDNSAFESLCADREQQATVLGTAQEIPPTREIKVKYVKCPVCAVLMHRTNFSNCSGVVIDVCKQHGTWFDAHELQRIIAFIQGGGIDRAREKQKRELDEARRRLESARQRDSGGYFSETKPYVSGALDAGDVVLALGEVVFSLLD